ncbi:hypothetical protein D3C72_1415510 [compost metagenome]
MLLQQQQGAAAIGGIIGDGNGCTVLQILDVLDLAGIGAKGLHVHLAIGNGHDAALAVLVVAVEVRLVLEEVGIELLVFDGGIGLHIVAELLDLQVHALSLELGLDEIQDFGVRHGRRSHFQNHVGSVGRHGQSRDGENGKRFFEHGVLQ